MFKKLFASSSEKGTEKKSTVNWIPLTTIDQLENLKSLSQQEPILIFKHSTRCGISRMVLKQFEKQIDASMSNLKLVYLDLLNHRDISNEIAAIFDVIHQSPQLLVISKEKVIEHASHYDITSIELNKYI